MLFQSGLEFHNHKKRRKKRKMCPLQIRMSIAGCQPDSRRRASFSASFIEASMTVEAALALPIFMMVMSVFIYFMIIMQVQTRLQIALNETAREMARFAFLYEQVMELSPEEEAEVSENLKTEKIEFSDVLYYGFQDVYALKLIRKRVGDEWLNSSCIEGGSGGLLILRGDILTSDEMIDLALWYRVKIPYFPGESKTFRMLQRCKIKAWTGTRGDKKAGEEQKEEIVYITETGSVYHKNRYCSHLNLSTHEVRYQTVYDKRNLSGGKYYACEHCVKKGMIFQDEDIIWITQTGDRYHGDRGCSGLKRSVIDLPISQVGNRTPCKRCGQ